MTNRYSVGSVISKIFAVGTISIRRSSLVPWKHDSQLTSEKSLTTSNDIMFLGERLPCLDATELVDLLYVFSNICSLHLICHVLVFML